jgi:ATP-dependent DNA helicase RecG
MAQERFSRNQVIVQVLSDFGFAERLGYGIDRMIRLMSEWDLPPPEFTETANGFKVTLRGPGEKLFGGDTDRSRWHSLNLNERQRTALQAVARDNHINNREYRDLFPDVSEETIRRDLADLVEQGILLKMGDKRGTSYILK